MKQVKIHVQYSFKSLHKEYQVLQILKRWIIMQNLFYAILFCLVFFLYFDFFPALLYIYRKCMKNIRHG